MPSYNNYNSYKDRNNYTSNGQNNHQNNQQSQNAPTPPPPYAPLNKLTYVNTAENIIKWFVKPDKCGEDKLNALTLSQIRILLDLINEVYIPVKNSPQADLSDGIKSKLQYIKMKMAYQAGRDGKVKTFINKTDLLRHIDHVKTKEDLILLAHYMEALVAYHKFYGGKDN